MLDEAEPRPFGATSPQWLRKSTNSIAHQARCCPELRNAVCKRQQYGARRKYHTISEHIAGDPAAGTHNLMLVAPHRLRHHGPTALTRRDAGCELREFLPHVVH